MRLFVTSDMFLSISGIPIIQFLSKIMPTTTYTQGTEKETEVANWTKEQVDLFGFL